MMLRELQAFEACWLDLKDVYPTSGQDNMLIAHAMGQLVDSLAKPAQIEQDLPEHLKGLFRRLALAYFQGYAHEEGQDDARAIAQRWPMSQPFPQDDCQQRAIAAAVSQVRALAQKKRIGRDRPTTPMSEMETLIIDFPEHWKAPA
jgi:hypothetical protein